MCRIDSEEGRVREMLAAVVAAARPFVKDTEVLLERSRRRPALRSDAVRLSQQSYTLLQIIVDAERVLTRPTAPRTFFAGEGI